MLYKNQVYEHKGSGQRVRILDQDEHGGNPIVWTFNMSQEKALPKDYALADLQAAIDNQDFILVDAPIGKSILKPSEATVRRRDASIECIEPLVKTMDIFEPSTRCALVRQRARELSCSEQTIYKYLRTWWRNGQSRNALTPDFYKIGSHAGHTGKRGRPPRYQNRPIYQMTAQDHKWIDETLKRYFLKSEVVTLVATYQRLLENHYSYIDNEGTRTIKAPGEHPSEAQFRWVVKKTLPRETSIRARKGDAHFELNNRAKLGSLRHETYTVGEKYQIDSTVADETLVHPENRAEIIGKPALYLAIDQKSNLIPGFYVGLESPSWPGAMQAVKSITEDKRALCKRYDVPYNPTDWPAHGILPKTFIADRGSEMLCGASSQLADGLDVIVQNLPARRGDHKPHVECGFKLLQRSIADAIPGYTPPENFGKRQKNDYSKDAALTLEEFTRVILLAIIRFNRTAMADYRLEPKYVLEGMQPTPINIWNAEIRDRAGMLTQYTEEEVRFALLPRREAIVTREGIQIDSCFYSAPEAMDKGWFVAAGKGRFNVQVSYDLRLVDAIYVHDDRHPAGYFVAQLLDKCSHFRGKSFAEVESLEYLATVTRHESRRTKHQLQSDFHGQIDPMVKDAVAKTKVASKGKSRSARKKDTVAARADALRQQRQIEARILPEVQPGSESAEVIALPAKQDPARSPQTAAVNAFPIKSHQLKYQELLNGR